MRKRSRGQYGCVLDAHAMMHFVAVLQAAENRDGILYARFLDQHRLETAFQRRVLLDVLLVFIERCGSNCAQLPASQGRFQHVGSVHGAFSRAGAH